MKTQLTHIISFTLLFLFNFSHSLLARVTPTHELPIPRELKRSTIGDKSPVVLEGDPDKDDEAARKSGRFATGLLYIKGGEKKGKAGTGIAVCPNVVLTACHVAQQLENGLQFVQGENARKDFESKKTHGTAVAESFCVPKGTQSEATDLALVRLKEPLPEKPTFSYHYLSNAKTLDPDNELVVVGYGLKTRGKNWSEASEGGIRRTGRIKPSDLDVSRDGTKLVTIPGRKKQLGSPGDSGAPVFEESGKGTLGKIIGVHVGGTASLGTEIPLRGNIAMVAPHFDLLSRQMKKWCPQTPTRTLSSVTETFAKTLAKTPSPTATAGKKTHGLDFAQIGKALRSTAVGTARNLFATANSLDHSGADSASSSAEATFNYLNLSAGAPKEGAFNFIRCMVYQAEYATCLFTDCVDKPCEIVLANLKFRQPTEQEKTAPFEPMRYITGGNITYLSDFITLSKWNDPDAPQVGLAFPVPAISGDIMPFVSYGMQNKKYLFKPGELTPGDFDAAPFCYENGHTFFLDYTSKDEEDDEGHPVTYKLHISLKDPTSLFDPYTGLSIFSIKNPKQPGLNSGSGH